MKELENTAEIVGGDGELAALAIGLAAAAGVVASGGLLGLALLAGSIELWR